MIPFAVRTGDIPPQMLEMFREMRSVFERLPDFSFDQAVGCHIICRAFEEHYPVECVDGHFGESFDHSWLVLKRYTLEEHGKTGQVIADMYPPGGATPFLVYTHFVLPWVELYREDPTVLGHVVGAAGFSEQVEAVSQQVGRLHQWMERQRE